jgi:CRISPR type III-B/RAMP module RAMP protein Cmr1
MKTETFHLELITPCFCGGAEPEKQAEIRAPSIRGQLRWWFRTLGGFKSLAPMPVRDQEAMIFGRTAGDEGQAGKLIVRVSAGGLTSEVRDGQELGHQNFSAPGYLTFPIQSREKAGQIIKYAGRGVIEAGSFKLMLSWRGNPALWTDLVALVSTFGHIGALGFRGRRAMGAMAVGQGDFLSLNDALTHFSAPNAIQIRKLHAQSAKHAISVLGAWIKSCRAHGRSGQNEQEMKSPYFPYAKNDHDMGYNMPTANGKAAFRPALGLPIIQRVKQGTNNWEWDWDTRKKKAVGRYASPVILRPHRDAQGNWHALVIFVDAHRWPSGKKVFLNGHERDVSLDLYNAMKNDKQLQPFP